MNGELFFLGLLFDKSSEAEVLKKSVSGLQQAANSFQWALINGIEKNIKSTIRIVSCLPVGMYPIGYKQIILKNKHYLRGEHEYVQLGTINLPFIKQRIRRKRIFLFFKKYLGVHADKKIVILIYSMYEPFLSACNQLKRRYGNRVVLCPIVTDLPLQYGIAKKKIIDRIWSYFDGNRKLSLIGSFDYYVLLTEQMRYPLKIENKPFVTVEGIANIEGTTAHKESLETKNIVYTGTLRKIFGLDILLDAFRKIPYANYRLQICGYGDMAEEIEKISRKDSRITYFGRLSHDKSIELQAQATVLVNPRQNSGEYVKYSFPSKTIEYMLSGTPVIMYSLPGIPTEYYEYVYTPTGCSAEDLAKEIIRVCEMPQKDRIAFGENAQEFIINNKSSVFQAKKILDMIQKSENIYEVK